jgi:hypothetical protein
MLVHFAQIPAKNEVHEFLRGWVKKNLNWFVLIRAIRVLWPVFLCFLSFLPIRVYPCPSVVKNLRVNSCNSCLMSRVGPAQ